MKNIKCRLAFAFVLGSIYSALIKYYDSSCSTVYDVLWVALTILLFSVITILATIEQIKNK